MDRTRLKKTFRKLLVAVLSLGQIFSFTGCLMKSVDARLETAPKFGSGVKTYTNSQDIISPVSHNMARFNVDGKNAFYILDGLEKDPESILSFELLDYTEDNEFIYHYITPAYIPSSEIASFKSDRKKAEGTVKDTDFTDVKREDYPLCDAEILMAYNPDTGHYRVMMARGFDLNWDPMYEKRPAYYPAGTVSGNTRVLISMEQRAYACKVPGRKEYFLFETDGMGFVYDISGTIIRSMDFRQDISYQLSMAQKKSEEEKAKSHEMFDPADERDRELSEAIRKDYENDPDPVYADRVKMIIKDVAISSEYYAYISCSTYTGYSPMSPDSYLSGCTFLSYSVNMNRNDTGISDYTSYNLNADKQFEAWKSLDGKYFSSRSELENTYGYSMDRMKKEGTLKDSFTPFYYDSRETMSGNTVAGVTARSSVIIGAEDLTDIVISDLSDDEKEEMAGYYSMPESDKKELEWYLDSYDRGSSRKRNRLLDFWVNKASNTAKKAFRSVHGLYYDRLLRKDSETGGTYDYFIWSLGIMGLLPRMGDWNDEKRINESKFFAEGPTAPSLHVLSFTHDISGVDIPHITDVDPLGMSALDSYHSDIENERTVPVPLAYIPETWRSVWYRSEDEARQLRDLYKETHPELENTVDSIRSILLDAESDPNTGGDNIFKLLKDITGDDAAAVEGELEYLQELLSEIPSADREYILNLCLDYVREDDSLDNLRYPVCYALQFPPQARASVNRDVDTNSKAGTLTGVKDGVLIAFDTDKEINHLGHESEVVFYSGIYGRRTMDSAASPGTTREIKEILWNAPGSGDETGYYVFATSYGVRFCFRNRYGEFEGLDFSGPIKNIWETFHPDGQYYGEWNTSGFIPYENLLVSTGYTRDTENKTFDAVEEILDNTLSENRGIMSDEDIKKSINDRFNGSIASADSIALIGKDMAMVCAVNGGTRFLNLKSGEVTSDTDDGSYYRLIQIGNTNKYKLLGFENGEYDYKECDLPMAKIYDRTYEDGSNGENDKTLIDAVKDTLKQMARDYLYRQYRTGLDNNDAVVKIQMPDSEKVENISEEKLFASGNPEDTTGEFLTELKLLEDNFGIKGQPEEITNYLYYLRKQSAALKPAITKLYTIAGATALATGPQREEAYWKNLDSRVTMAINTEALKSILVEIRMHPDVASSLDPEQKAKYDSYRSVLDYSAEQGKVKNGEYDFVENISSNEAQEKFDDAELKTKYRRDVLNDIMEDYAELYPDGDFDKTLLEILNQVNPDNLILAEDEALDEFIDLINHGASVLGEDLFNEMKERLKEKIPGITSVWEMEKLIISEKIKQPKFEKYLTLYEEYEKTSDTLRPEERPVLLRRTEFYKDIIGGLKTDVFVKDFLATKKETWEDYIREVILNAGSGVVKDDSGLIEGSPYNEAIEEWRKLSE